MHMAQHLDLDVLVGIAIGGDSQSVVLMGVKGKL